MSTGKPPDPESRGGAPVEENAPISTEDLFTQTSEKVKPHPSDTEFQRSLKLAVFDGLKKWLATGGREHLERARQKAKMIRREPHE